MQKEAVLEKKTTNTKHAKKPSATDKSIGGSSFIEDDSIVVEEETSAVTKVPPMNVAEIKRKEDDEFRKQ